MYEEFTRRRITQLRVQKNASAREMSLDLGQNEGYITQIENGHKMPSVPVLFYICQYFGISPQEFFDEGNLYPAELDALIADLKKLDVGELEHVAQIVRDILKGK